MTVNQEHVRYSADQYDSYTANCVEQFDRELAKQVAEEARAWGPERLCWTSAQVQRAFWSTFPAWNL